MAKAIIASTGGLWAYKLMIVLVAVEGSSDNLVIGRIVANSPAFSRTHDLELLRMDHAYADHYRPLVSGGSSHCKSTRVWLGCPHDEIQECWLQYSATDNTPLNIWKALYCTIFCDLIIFVFGANVSYR